MKTYRTPGATATEWSPTGNSQEVQRIESIYGVDGTTAIAVPVLLSLKGETTKKGSRRVVLRSEALLPGAVVNDMTGGTYVDPKSTQTISAHVVITAPQILAQSDVASGAGAAGVTALIANMLSDLVAVLSDESNTANADYRTRVGLVATALVGAPSLDVVSGAYGESSARS